MLREAPVAMLDGRPVIVGAGVAGLATALHLAPEPCVLVSSGPLCGASSSMLAQRGLAASFGADDAPALHEADTLAAGDGLCDPSAVRLMTKAAPQALDWLESIGARFDRGPDGKHILGLEAAHSRRRIAHAQGDASGREAMRALARAARDTPSITVLEGMQVRRLLLSHSEISGVVLSEDAGRAHVLASRRVVLATGGIGGLFAQSTNPASSFGG